MTRITDVAREAVEHDEKRTQGTWEWFGNTKHNEVYLATKERGRVFVMDFVRWGMRGAQPRFQVQLDDTPGSGIMRTLGELAQEESPLGPRFEVSYRRQFVGIGHPDAAAIPFAVNNLRALAETVLAWAPVIEAAKEWAAAAPGSPKWAAKSWRLREALSTLSKEPTDDAG